MLPSPTLSSPGESGSTMQGTLWKWTNYLSGWQPRWFVLDAGCLSYFLSPNEVHLGSRGSIKVSSCDILVHPSDHQRMDMVMPGGRHIYLRAASMTERQQWLLALGVAKQGGLESIDSSGTKNGTSTSLQKKMTELQDNCQLLASQIASIQSMTSDPSKLDSKVLSELSSEVSVTCDQFLHTLRHCMELSLSSQQLTSSLKPLPLMELYASKKGGGVSPVNKLSGFSEADLYPSAPPPTPPSLGLPPAKHIMSASRPRKATPAQPPGKEGPPAHLLNSEAGAGGGAGEEEAGVGQSVDAGSAGVDTAGESSDTAKANADVPRATSSMHSRSHSTSDFYVTPASSPRQLTPPPPPRPARIGERVAAHTAEVGRKHETFFSSLSAKFQDLELLEEDLIPTHHFLQCCQAVLPFFDTLSATAFAPVKADIGGNISKLSGKYEEAPDQYDTLQAMVEAEIKQGTHNAKNSATDALLWLKRAMEFVQQFIAEVAGGEQSLDVAAGKAYGVSLRRYHGWMVRGVFYLAVKAVPYHKDFLKVLGSLGSDEGERQVNADMAVFAASLGEIVLILNLFYQRHQIDSPPAQ